MISNWSQCVSSGFKGTRPAANSESNPTMRRIRFGDAFRRLAIFIPLTLALIAFAPNLQFAATYFVAESGSDNNPGTSQLPFLTITKGVSVLAAGDTLEVKAGTYVEQVHVDDVHGTTSNRITIKTFGSDVVTIDGTGVTSHPFRVGFLIDNSSYITLDGFAFTNWRLAVGAAGTSAGPGMIDSDNIIIKNFTSDFGWMGVRVLRSTNFLISDCDVSGSVFHGVNVEDSHGGVVERCVSHDNTYDSENDGIHIGNSTNILIQDCVAYNNWEQGFDASGHQVPASSNVTFRNCVAYNNGLISDVSGFKIAGYSSDGILVDNCVAFNNGFSGINFDEGTINSTVKNFTSWNNVDGYRVILTGCPQCITPTNLTVQDSISYDNSDPMTVNTSVVGDTLNYNGYWLDSDTGSPISYKNVGSYLLSQFSTYQSETGQDANSLVGNPQFVNTSDPDGPDDIWFTADDGLLLSPTSPFKNAASDGGDMGYRPTATGSSTTSITLSDPSPTAAGNVTVTLMTSSPVVFPDPIPQGCLTLTDSTGTTSAIDLSGSIPGATFTGTLLVDGALADGVAVFSLSPGCSLVDGFGNPISPISAGSQVVIDQTPPSAPTGLTGS